MSQIAAILRHIGTQAKTRLGAVRTWISTVCNGHAAVTEQSLLALSQATVSVTKSASSKSSSQPSPDSSAQSAAESPPIDWKPRASATPFTPFKPSQPGGSARAQYSTPGPTDRGPSSTSKSASPSKTTRQVKPAPSASTRPKPPPPPPGFGHQPGRPWAAPEPTMPWRADPWGPPPPPPGFGPPNPPMPFQPFFSYADHYNFSWPALSPSATATGSTNTGNGSAATNTRRSPVPPPQPGGDWSTAPAFWQAPPTGVSITYERGRSRTRSKRLA